jgi:hypothetical protein
MNRIERIKHLRSVLGAALILAPALMGGTGVRAESQTGGAPGDWLARYAGARTMGIGGAFVATADDPLGAVWNPAGLSKMFQNEVRLESARLFEGTSINGLSFAMPNQSFPSFGLTVLSLRSGAFQKTNDLNESLGEFHESDMAFLLSGSKSLSPRLSLGANLKVVRQSIDEFDGAGVGADFGLLFDVSSSIRMGASLLNVGGPSLTLRETEESYPMEFRGGMALQVFSGRGLVSAELNHRSGPGASFHGGTEFWVHPSMALRLGYSESSPTGGFSYKVAPGMQLDYSMADSELGVTHRIGFSYKFGGFFASSDAQPPVFSPIGRHSVTKIHLKARTKADATRWSLAIVDKSDHVIRRFGGKGGPPSHIMWDGKDEAGLPLPDGVYHYQLVVDDLDGRTIMGHEQTVEIITEGPEGSVPVVVD